VLIPPHLQSAKDILENVDQDDLVIFQMMASNTNDLLNSHSTIGVWDVLGTMRTTRTLFKTLTNFTLEELDELAS
jgi:hypothetical protein